MAHYYKPDGTLIATVPNASKGGTRETNLTDARKLGLLPSWTTVMQLLAKPMLSDWRVRQGIKAALDTPVPLHLPREEREKAIYKASEEYTNWSADFGTAVHAGICAGLKGETWWTGDAQVLDVVMGFWPFYHGQGFDCEMSEHTFVSRLGYAGTLDYIGKWQGKTYLLDFKTQDAATRADFRFYDEYPLQLAGYAVGIERSDLPRASVVISRTKPGLCDIKTWDNNMRYDNAAFALWNLWKLMKNWGGK